MKYSQEMNIAKKFMADLASDFTDKKKAFIVVSHINPTSIPFINTIAHNGRIAGVVAKPNSIHFPTYEKLHDKVFFLDVNKQDLMLPNIINKKVAPLVRDDENLIIIDIGGYFAGALKQLNALPNLVGIIEDTENGLQKYERALNSYPDNKIPILSVARSRAKDFEDYLIGRSIAVSSLEVLRQSGESYKHKKLGIIGFGEVGRGAAFYLKDKIGADVRVFDSNPKVQNLIKKSGFRAIDRNELLANSEVLFCMTGNKSLMDTDIQMMKDGCFVASCTSSDDEFGFRDFEIKSGEKTSENIRNTAGINFINDGNAVNFLHPQNLEKMLSPYIYLTHSALLECAVRLDNGDNFSTKTVNIIEKDREKEIISSFRRSIKSENKNAKFINAILNTKLGNKSK